MTTSTDSPQFNADHYRFMTRALALAKQAAELGEVPVGAVVVRNNEIVGEGYNRPITDHDPTAHAEIIALRAAAQQVGNYRLVDCQLYVTIEPCSMCVGALHHARISHLYYGASEPKSGAVSSGISLANAGHFNHTMQITGGLMDAECSALISAFFAGRREQKKTAKAAAGRAACD